MNKKIGYISRCINRLIRNTNWYNESLWGGSTKFWNCNQFGLDIINLGSSAGLHAFDYKDLNIKAANWALGPQSLVHDYNILKNYFSYIKERGVVIITVCPFSGLVSKYGKEHNLKYYTFLHPATIINFDEKERQRALKLKLNTFNEAPLYCIKQTTKDFIRMLKPAGNVNFEQSAKQIVSSWKNQFGIRDFSMPASSNHKDQINHRRKTLQEMIIFCKERSFVPFIIIPVMHTSLSSLFSDTFKNIYINSLIDGAGATVLDYMNDEMGFHDEYFETSLLLNKFGAKEFTKKVISEIALQGYL